MLPANLETVLSDGRSPGCGSPMVERERKFSPAPWSGKGLSLFWVPHACNGNESRSSTLANHYIEFKAEVLDHGS